MGFISDWIVNVIAFILLAAVIDLLLPSSEFQKYVKLVLGLLLVMVMLSPLWKLMSVDVGAEFQRWTERQSSGNQLNDHIMKQTTDLQVTNEMLIVKQSEESLKEMAETEVKEKFNQTIAGIDIKIDQWKQSLPESLKRVDVYVSNGEAVNAPNAIQEIVIDSSVQTQSKKEVHPELVSFLSKKWNIPEEQLNILMIEEGDSLE
ncbi:stage III sporulation protein AF [Bacillus ectoiniformans]|uniref:stage III sporulation protein AF n=1 Tax=Bacillus ectoiniformans TaxID=1494429 RepID=UPI0019567591|nr:stage III sporulation protein AF [Bacillus ectoiniformans]MBM7650438.1 stage III sporulation protein AF [Bacillus ectoiniformans]